MGAVLCNCQFDPPMLRPKKGRRRTSSQMSQGRSVGTTATADNASPPLAPRDAPSTNIGGGAIPFDAILPTATIRVLTAAQTRNPLVHPDRTGGVSLAPGAFVAVFDDSIFNATPSSELSSNTTLRGRFPSLELPPMLREELAAGRLEAWEANLPPDERIGHSVHHVPGVLPKVACRAQPPQFLGITSAGTSGGVCSSSSPRPRVSSTEKASHSSSRGSPLFSGMPLGTPVRATAPSPKLLRAAEANTDTLMFSIGSPPHQLNSTDTSSIVEYKAPQNVAAPVSARPLVSIITGGGRHASTTPHQERTSLVVSFRHRMMVRATSTLSSHVDGGEASFRTATDETLSVMAGGVMLGARPSSEAAMLRHPSDASSRTMSVLSPLSSHHVDTAVASRVCSCPDSPLFEQVVSPTHNAGHFIDD